MGRDDFPELVLSVLDGARPYAGDDAVLRDAFDAADVDGDGAADLKDVVEWLGRAAARTRDRATLALERKASGAGDDDRLEFASWPEQAGGLTLDGRRLHLELRGGRLTIRPAEGADPCRVLALHPSVARIDRVGTETLDLVLGSGDEEETLRLGAADAADGAAWWTAVSETLAVHRRLRSAPPARADVDVVRFVDDAAPPRGGSQRSRRL